MLFLDALSQKNTNVRPPVWLMRQAGRYMHEYMTLRNRYDFLTLCQSPELVAEITHQPIDAFGFDAAIVFSDILLIVRPLGFRLRYEEEVGPVIENPLQVGDQLHFQEVVQALDFVPKAITLLKQSLKVPLIGFAGAPFTVASYLIEGKSSRDLLKTKKWLYEEPDSFAKVLDVLADCTIDYLNAQIDAGCDAIQIFDSWAMHLAPAQFHMFVVEPIKKIVTRLKKCPTILYCRGLNARALAEIAPSAISCDATLNMQNMRRDLGSTALQGNLDPDILLTNPKVVVKETKALLDAMRGDPGFIFNLGHGVHKSTPRDNVKALVDCVKSYG